MSIDPLQSGATSQLQSAMAAQHAGQSAGAQFKLCGILPAIGMESNPFSLQPAGLSFMQKNVLPGQGGLFDALFPSSHGMGAKFVDKLFAFLKNNSALTSQADIINMASDLQISPDVLQAFAQLQGHDIPEDKRAAIFNQAANIVAMNHSAMHQHDDIGRG